MKTRILAFLVFILIAVGWHFLLVRRHPLTPVSQQMSDPDQQERKPAGNSSSQLSNPSAIQGFTLLNQTRQQFAYLRECLKTRNCAFPKVDPRSYDFAVAQRAQELVSQLQKKVEAEKIQDQRISQFAVEAFQWPNDQVREASLQLLQTQPPSLPNLQGMISGLSNSHDPSIYHQAMNEMKRYSDSQSRLLINQFLLKAVQDGGFYASAQVARDLMPFLNQTNVASFQSLLAKIDPSTQKFKALKESLNEYELR